MPRIADSSLATLEIAGRLGSLNIRIDLLARRFIHNFAPKGISDVGFPIASGRQPAPHAVNAFAQDDLYRLDAPAQDYDVERLSCGSYANGNFLVVHKMVA